MLGVYVYGINVYVINHSINNNSKSIIVIITLCMISNVRLFHDTFPLYVSHASLTPELPKTADPREKYHFRLVTSKWLTFDN